MYINVLLGCQVCGGAGDDVDAQAAAGDPAALQQHLHADRGCRHGNSGGMGSGLEKNRVFLVFFGFFLGF